MRRFHVLTLLLAVLSAACRSNEPKSAPPSETTSVAIPAAPILSAPKAEAPAASAPAAPTDSTAKAEPTRPSMPAVPLIRPAEPKKAAPVPDEALLATMDRGARAEATIAEYDALRTAYEDNFRGVKSAEDYEKLAASVKVPDYTSILERLWKTVDEAPADDTSFRVLSWMLQQGQGGPRVVDELAKHHAGREGLAPLCYALARGEEGHRGFVRELARTSPHAAVRGLASHALTGTLKDEIESARDIQAISDPAELAQWKEWIGEEGVRKAKELDVAAAEKQLLADLRLIQRDYADVKTRRSTLGETVKSELFELENLSIGKVAPEITGESIAGAPMKLSDYRGKVVVLDFWGNW